MKLSIKLIEKNAQIQKDIADALLPLAISFMNSFINEVKKNLPNLIEDAIKNSPEYFSILNGKLKYELGIPDPSAKLIGLIDLWINNIQYEYKPPAASSKGIKSTFSAKMIKADFEDVLSSQFAEVQDISRGYNLPWLKWLLLEGNTTIIDEHEVIIGPSRYSRTGNAIMKSNRTKNWQVPSEFSGTQADNWITRAIDGASPIIQSMLEKAVKQ
jgi:hypothetical protein